MKFKALISSFRLSNNCVCYIFIETITGLYVCHISYNVLITPTYKGPTVMKYYEIHSHISASDKLNVLHCTVVFTMNLHHLVSLCPSF